MTLLSELIRHDDPDETGAECRYPYSPVLEKKYKFISRFGDEVLLHRRDGQNIWLPRALCPVGANDQRLDGKTVIFPKCPDMRPDQKDWFPQTAEFLLEGQSGIVIAGTGRGKTVCGFYAAHKVQKKTLVICTKEDIYKKWIEGATQFLGVPPHKVGEIRQDKCEVKGTDFVVAMIHSLSIPGKYPNWIGDEFGLIIFDEAHRLPADQFSTCATMFRAKLRLALTATLERPDGKEMMLLAHIGPVRVKAEGQLMVPKVLRYRTAWQVPKTFRRDKKTGLKKVVPMPHEPGKTMHIEKNMALDPVRNALICEKILACYEKNRKVVVFSSLVDHLTLLHRAMVDLGVPGKEMGRYGPVKNKKEEAEREKVKVKPIIWTTWNMMKEGTDIPWLDVCMLTMPLANCEQAVGRIRREFEGKVEAGQNGGVVPTVFDFVDAASGLFKAYAGSRQKWYAKVGATVVDMDE
jgi:superfamily II DNA or RNA helicase